MSDLKNSWKSTGAGLGGAFKSLGKTLINSGKKGVDKAVEWAGREDAPDGQPAESVNTAAEPAQSEAAENTEQVVSVAEELRRLAELRDMGIITEEEFNAKKKQMLGI